MTRIIRFFLRAKAWEIFLLLVGIMVVSQIGLVSSIQRPAGDFGTGLPLFAGLILLFMFCFLGWFWAMGSFLNSIVQPRVRPGAGFFHFALVYPMLYGPVFMISFPPQPSRFAIIVPLHVLATVCMFYVLNFVSRNLVLAETNRDVTFHDYAGPFFLLWFFPIGVWTVQPRINRLYAEAKKSAQ